MTRALPRHEPQVLGPEQRIALLEAQLERQLNTVDPGRVAIVQMFCILGGVITIVGMLCSFAWNALMVSIESAEKQSARAHELAMAAVQASAERASEVPAYSPEMIGFFCFLAVVASLVLVCLLRKATGK